MVDCSAALQMARNRRGWRARASTALELWYYSIQFNLLNYYYLIALISPRLPKRVFSIKLHHFSALIFSPKIITVKYSASYAQDARRNAYKSSYKTEVPKLLTGSGAHSLLYNGYRGPFPGLKHGQGVTLTTHPHLVPRSRMSRSYTSSFKLFHGM
jgi:hypothetical protein